MTGPGRNKLQERAVKRTDHEPADLAHRIVDLASDKKTNNVVMLRTSEVTSMADYFIICSGRSEAQVQALSGAIIDTLRDEGVRAMGVEGLKSAGWVLIDYGSVIVHVFSPEEREYYGLERLWSEAARVVRMI